MFRRRRTRTIIIDPLHSPGGEHHFFLTGAHGVVYVYAVCFQCDLRHRVSGRWRRLTIFDVIEAYEKMLVQ